MNLESKLKADLVTACKKLGAYARRHEDRYALGLLDLSIKFPGHPHLLAEGKIVEHQKFAPTPRQYEEGWQYTKAGGLACLIGWLKSDKKKMYVAEWSKTAMRETSFHSDKGNHAEQLREWLESLESRAKLTALMPEAPIAKDVSTNAEYRQGGKR